MIGYCLHFVHTCLGKTLNPGRMYTWTARQSFCGPLIKTTAEMSPLTKVMCNWYVHDCLTFVIINIYMPCHCCGNVHLYAAPKSHSPWPALRAGGKIHRCVGGKCPGVHLNRCICRQFCRWGCTCIYYISWHGIINIAPYSFSSFSNLPLSQVREGTGFSILQTLWTWGPALPVCSKRSTLT